MAHSTLHFSFGMVIGSLFALPAYFGAWLKERRPSIFFKQWILWSYAAGTYAVIPGILRRCGVDDAICDAAWMNVFLLYPWMNAVKPGAETMGPLVLGALLGGQYLVLLFALAGALRRRRQDDSR